MKLSSWFYLTLVNKCRFLVFLWKELYKNTLPHPRFRPNHYLRRSHLSSRSLSLSLGRPAHQWTICNERVVKLARQLHMCGKSDNLYVDQFQGQLLNSSLILLTYICSY